MASSFLKALNQLMSFDKTTMENETVPAKSAQKKAAGNKSKKISKTIKNLTEAKLPKGMQSVSFEKKETVDCHGKHHVELKAKVCAEGDKCFWVKDGRVLKNLDDLATALEDMSQESFAHHVRGDDNDFSNWIRFVLMDGHTADKMLSAKTLPEARKIVLDAIKAYK